MINKIVNRQYAQKSKQMQHNKILVLRVILLLFFIFSFTSVNLYSQEYNPDETETNPLVLEKIEWFQDVKFGLMMHWGPYSQWGIVESWSLCSEDEPWSRNIYVGNK